MKRTRVRTPGNAGLQSGMDFVFPETPGNVLGTPVGTPHFSAAGFAFLGAPKETLFVYTAMALSGYRGVTSGLTSEATEVSRSPLFWERRT